MGSSCGPKTIGGDGVLAVICLGGEGVLLLAGSDHSLCSLCSLCSLGCSLLSMRRSGSAITLLCSVLSRKLLSASSFIFTDCVALLNPTALCLDWRQLPFLHCGLPQDLSVDAPPGCGGVTWCIFCTTISWCMSWYVCTSCSSSSAPGAFMCTSSFALPSARSRSFVSFSLT
jgi:hypothetical protein